MEVEVNITNNANSHNRAGIMKIMCTGCIEINGELLVDYDTAPIHRTVIMQDKIGNIVWKRTKHDRKHKKTIYFNVKGDGTDIIEIRNAPSFDGVKVLVNGKLLKEEYKRHLGLS